MSSILNPQAAVCVTLGFVTFLTCAFLSENWREFPTQLTFQHSCEIKQQCTWGLFLNYKMLCKCKLLLLVLMNMYQDIVKKNCNSWTERKSVDNEVVLMACPWNSPFICVLLTANVEEDQSQSANAWIKSDHQKMWFVSVFLLPVP